VWLSHDRIYLDRSDRYSHELETEDTEDDDGGDDVMFQSFSSCSPRYSLVCQKFEEFRDVSCDFFVSWQLNETSLWFAYGWINLSGQAVM
jgi:hypothetical protein